MVRRIGLLCLAALAALAQPVQPSKIKICIANFRGDAEGEAARDVIFEVLLSSPRLFLSEQCEGADLIVRGSAMSKTLKRSRSEGESTQHASVAGVATRTGAAIGGLAIGSEEQLASAETRNETTVTARVTKSDGTVIWAGSWDSTGGKNRNSTTDAAERVARRFLREYLNPSKPSILVR